MGNHFKMVNEIITLIVGVGVPIVGGVGAMWYKMGKVEQKVTGNCGHITELKGEVKKIKEYIFNGRSKK